MKYKKQNTMKKIITSLLGRLLKRPYTLLIFHFSLFTFHSFAQNRYCLPEAHSACYSMSASIDSDIVNNVYNGSAMQGVQNVFLDIAHTMRFWVDSANLGSGGGSCPTCIKDSNVARWGVGYITSVTMPTLSSTAAGNIGYLLQGNGNAAPSWVSALSSTVQNNITATGTITTGTWASAITPVAEQQLTASGGLFTWNVTSYPSAIIIFAGATAVKDSLEISGYQSGGTYNLVIEQNSYGYDTLVIYQHVPASYEANAGGISGGRQALTLTSSANAIDFYTVYYSGALGFFLWTGANDYTALKH